MITGHISLVDHLEGPDGKADVCLGAVVERVSHPNVCDLDGGTGRPGGRPGARRHNDLGDNGHHCSNIKLFRSPQSPRLYG